MSIKVWQPAKTAWELSLFYKFCKFVLSFIQNDGLRANLSIIVIILSRLNGGLNRARELGRSAPVKLTGQFSKLDYSNDHTLLHKKKVKRRQQTFHSFRITRLILNFDMYFLWFKIKETFDANHFKYVLLHTFNLSNTIST